MWSFYTPDGEQLFRDAPGPPGPPGPGVQGAYTFMTRPTPQTGVGRKFFTDRAGTFVLMYAWATDAAPTGTASFNLRKNGATIATCTIGSGQFLGSDTTTFNPNTFVKGDKLEIEVTSTGGAQGRLGVVIKFTE